MKTIGNYFRQFDLRHFSFSLLLAVIALCSIGAFCIFKADGTYRFYRHLAGIGIGTVLVFIVAFMDYHFLCKFTALYYVASIFVLFLVRFTRFGTDLTTGAYRWLQIGGIDVQPSELVKVVMIFVYADFFTRMKDRMDRFWVFLLSCVIAAIPTFLILIQTDLSSSMVQMFIFAVALFTAGLSLKILLPVIGIGVPTLIGLFWYVQQPFQRILTTVQQNRILSFLHPEEYASSGRYQQIRSVQAIAQGGVLGKLLTGDVSDYRGYNYVYVNESDFIFSVLGEELGFAGCCLVLLLFAFVVGKCIMIARKARDERGRLLALGVSAMLTFQMFVNIGVATELLPNTGLPLPFLSYGLTSLVSSFLATGVVINVGLMSGARRKTGNENRSMYL